jgi:isopentenyl diphosphate isomerase/L-lactate dehydrogenase-like FMN-dependent dehydrogenase
MAAVLSYRDLRARARRKLPRFAFDFIDGGAGDEAGLDRNEAAFRARSLQPRVLVNSARPSGLQRRFLGRDWALPFGIPPIGLAGLAWPEIDLILAEAAERAQIPYVASTPSTVALERLRKAAPQSGWFQLYVGKSEEITEDLLARARKAGYRTLVVTADVPRPGRRLRDLRNGFALPLKPGPRLAADLLRHPGWALRTARRGAPRFANLEPYAGPASSAQSLAQLMAGQSSGRLDWALLRQIRDGWDGPVILKGVSAPQDAVTAAEAGVDAVWISNHGGRQLSSSPASLEVVEEIRRALPAGYPLALDGGIRSGEDMIKALAAGADFVFTGRPFLYAVAALGPEGAARLVAQFANELDNTMAQIGWSDLDLGRAPG